MSYLTTTLSDQQQQKVGLNPHRLQQQLAQVLLGGQEHQQVSLIGATATAQELASPCKSPSDLLSSMSLSDGAPMRQRSHSGDSNKQQVPEQSPQRMQHLGRLLRQTNSLEEMPTYGVESLNEEQLGSLMKQIDVWGLNIFEVHQCSQEHSLTVIMYRIFQVSFSSCTWSWAGLCKFHSRY